MFQIITEEVEDEELGRKTMFGLQTPTGVIFHAVSDERQRLADFVAELNADLPEENQVVYLVEDFVRDPCLLATDYID